MNTIKISGKLIGAGILSAILASSCCIVPLLALIAGSGGFASSFSWTEPARPYLIGLSFSVLALAWYQKLKPRVAEEDCCAVSEKPRIIQSKTFLVVVTIFVLTMMAFPYYSKWLSGESNKQLIILDNSKNIHTIELNISGMTCTGCEGHIEHAVNNLPGIVEVNASYENATTQVKYDSTRTNMRQIEAAIESTGYSIINTNNKN